MGKRGGRGFRGTRQGIGRNVRGTGRRGMGEGRTTRRGNWGGRKGEEDLWNEDGGRLHHWGSHSSPSSTPEAINQPV